MSFNLLDNFDISVAISLQLSCTLARSSGDLASKDPTNAPWEVPPHKSTGTPVSCNALITPRCARPLAPPPPRTRPTDLPVTRLLSLWKSLVLPSLTLWYLDIQSRSPIQSLRPAPSSVFSELDASRTTSSTLNFLTTVIHSTHSSILLDSGVVSASTRRRTQSACCMLHLVHQLNFDSASNNTNLLFSSMSPSVLVSLTRSSVFRTCMPSLPIMLFTSVFVRCLVGAIWFKEPAKIVQKFEILSPVDSGTTAIVAKPIE
mmetsp:Transcript_23480/g.55463  ORF Transcript_23480/g.55463 Transcript_23480/m.55463 type:complete len:260 (-) Transcript_23480:596-1375(-)